MSLTLECVACEGVWVVLWHGLKLSTESASSEPPWRSRPSSATACALPGTTQHELQKDMQMAAACVGLGGVQERLNYVMSPTAVSALPGAT